MEACQNCGAWKGLHHAETMQCPAGGVEEVRPGHPQKWSATNFKSPRDKIRVQNSQLMSLLESIDRVVLTTTLDFVVQDDTKEIIRGYQSQIQQLKNEMI